MQAIMLDVEWNRNQCKPRYSHAKSLTALQESVTNWSFESTINRKIIDDALSDAVVDAVP